MRSLFVLALVVLARASAYAEPQDIVSRPLVLARGQLEAQLAVEANLRTNLVGRPLSFSPDIWAGLTDRLTLGITHSNTSLDRIAPGASFCVGTLVPECERGYRGSALDARYLVHAGAFSIAPRARLVLRDVDPIKPAITLGALMRWQRGRTSITSDPYLRLGLANRDEGNRAALSVPIWVGIQPTCRWMIALHTGWDSDLAVWRDGWHGPFALLVRARATTHLDASVEAGFSTLFGPQNNVAQRAIVVALSWRS